MNTKEDYIGVFDSGVGGISVLRHLRRVMPNEKFLYYGDSANAPYGIRTKAEVQALSFAVAEKLMARGLKALVIACNTATSAAVKELREKYPDLIIVGIEPALKLAADRYPGGGWMRRGCCGKAPGKLLLKTAGIRRKSCGFPGGFWREKV